MSVWIDIGDGHAIDASMVKGLNVSPPWPPDMIRVRAMLEQKTWTVNIRYDVYGRPIGCHPDEASARSHAHRVVRAMLDRADELSP